MKLFKQRTTHTPSPNIANNNPNDCYWDCEAQQFMPKTPTQPKPPNRYKLLALITTSAAVFLFFVFMIAAQISTHETAPETEPNHNRVLTGDLTTAEIAALPRFTTIGDSKKVEYTIEELFRYTDYSKTDFATAHQKYLNDALAPDIKPFMQKRLKDAQNAHYLFVAYSKYQAWEEYKKDSKIEAEFKQHGDQKVKVTMSADPATPSDAQTERAVKNKIPSDLHSDLQFNTKFWSGTDGYPDLLPAGRDNSKYLTFYPNYADKDLFYGAASYLFAQDEWNTWEFALNYGMRKILRETSSSELCTYQMHNMMYSPPPTHTEDWKKEGKVPSNYTMSQHVNEEMMKHCNFFLGAGTMVITDIPRLFTVNAKKGEGIYGEGKGLAQKMYGEGNELMWKKQILEGQTLDERSSNYRMGGPDTWIKPDTIFTANNLQNLYIFAAPDGFGSYKRRKGNDFVDQNKAALMLCPTKNDLVTPVTCSRCTDQSLVDAFTEDNLNKTEFATKWNGYHDQKDFEKMTHYSYVTREEDNTKYELCFREPKSDKMLWYGNEDIYMTKADLEETFKIAVAGFKMIKNVANDKKKKVDLHLGNWGCGVFSHNYYSSAMIQLIAAKSVDLNRIAYHEPDGFLDRLKFTAFWDIYVKEILFQNEPSLTWEEFGKGLQRIADAKLFAWNRKNLMGKDDVIRGPQLLELGKSYQSCKEVINNFRPELLSNPVTDGKTKIYAVDQFHNCRMFAADKLLRLGLPTDETNPTRYEMQLHVSEAERGLFYIPRKRSDLDQCEHSVWATELQALECCPFVEKRPVQRTKIPGWWCKDVTANVKILSVGI